MRANSIKRVLEDAFESATNAFAQDMPMLMHGSGGDEINPSAQKLVAALTVQYCQRLVESAIDAWDMQQPNHEMDVPPPPPPLSQRSRKPRVPPLHTSLTATKHGEKRKHVTDDFWDLPLPKPKIRGQETPQIDPDTGSHEQADNWVGLAGVDMWEHSRARAAHVMGISTQHFIFPICHDTYVYGRIREIQAALLSTTEPLMYDATVIDAVRTDGQLQTQHRQASLQKRRRLKKKINKTNKRKDGLGGSLDKHGSGITSDPEDEDEPDDEEAEEDVDGATWPGLASVLPAHRDVV